jgi:hypothetical protein
MSGELIKEPMPAKRIVRWLGQDTAACDAHLRQLVGLGAILGIMVTWTHCEETVCDNCESQFKYLTPEERSEVMERFKRERGVAP